MHTSPLIFSVAAQAIADGKSARSFVTRPGLD